MRKKVLYVAIFFLALKIYNQCVPDCQYNAYGIFPEVLPTAYINSPYDQTLTFTLPPDSTLPDGTYVLIDSIRTDSIKGLPSSFSWACQNANCLWPSNVKGCIRIFGTPTWNDYGIHKLYAFHTLWVRVQVYGGGYVSLVTNDTTTKYSLFVDWPFGISEINPYNNSKQTYAILYNIYGKKYLMNDVLPPGIYIYFTDKQIEKKVVLP